MSDERYTRIMVDVETLGLRPGAVVLQIAAVPFDENYSPITDNVFNSYIHVGESILMSGMSVEPGTAEWWQKQDHGLRKRAASGEELPVTAASSFYFWWATNAREDAELWCNGTDFDVPHLVNFLERHGSKPLWKHHAVRDLRTLRKLAESTGWTAPNTTVESLIKCRPVTPHDALSDALYQIEVLGSIMRDVFAYTPAWENCE